MRNKDLQTYFLEDDINVDRKWKVHNIIMGEQELDFFIRCLPESEIGANSAPDWWKKTASTGGRTC